jgi:hypothetical protein
MNKYFHLAFLASIFMGFTAPLCAQAPASQSEVGVASAATLIATGKPPHQPERVLEIGTDLVEDEKITTSETGRIHLLFRDGSTLTVGPNSNLVLDTYLYDPKAKSGKIAFSATKGVFRFIGGRISKSSRVEFKTPVATLGIRGGINQFSVGPSGRSVTTTHIFGDETTIATGNGNGGIRVTTLARQEFRAAIDAAGGIAFSRLTAEQFANMNRMFETPPGIVALGLPAAGGQGGANVPVPALSPDLPPALSDPAGDALLNDLRSLEPFDTSVIQRVLQTNVPTIPACIDDSCF